MGYHFIRIGRNLFVEIHCNLTNAVGMIFFVIISKVTFEKLNANSFPNIYIKLYIFSTAQFVLEYQLYCSRNDTKSEMCTCGLCLTDLCLLTQEFLEQYTAKTILIFYLSTNAQGLSRFHCIVFQQLQWRLTVYIINYSTLIYEI